ncbi:serine protease [Clostridium baratii]|uniref:S1C family serine protease n=1 Tax=Clostridium baratii TaxID=1561 RepID=UPI0009A3FF81|nr:trypsin-like peptidase domain-containing protein [Clostridium baratii]OPF52884.1 serine protease [Clostridium baratii]OPF56331.1 serine protease [Clostridium baratii]OPF58074.1 serine protease [Clostridium baratii]OPF59287.1 serine protease [Clostridium baratii]
MNTENNNNEFNNENIGYNGYMKNENDNKQVKKKKKSGKTAITVVIVIVIALLSGMAGSGITYYMVGKQDKQNEGTNQNNYATQSFKSDSKMTTQEVFKKVAPSVVIVSTKGLMQNGYIPQEVEGIGSGFIINEDGDILTNYHVVEGAQEVTVTLSTGKEYKAKVVNYDQNQDVALIRMQGDFKVPAVAELGDSAKVSPGEEVIAIGTPLSKDFAQTVTKGVVSAIGRTVTTKTGNQVNLIQTDTAINPGNSGGPLVNAEGKVIGINTLKLAGGAEGIGFAIPIDEVKAKLDILSKQKVSLGIRVKNVDKALSKEYDIPEGIYIAEVDEFSAAEKAGLKPGDVIVKIDGKDTKTFDKLSAVLNTKTSGDTIKVTFIRDGKTKTTDVALK